MSIFFVSDSHFNHFNICNYSNRPFLVEEIDNEDLQQYKSRVVDNMNTAMISQWNSVISDDDEVYHLGDFGFKNSYGWPLEVVFGQLKGRKHLVRGNHDWEYADIIFNLDWEWIKDYHEIRLSKHKLIVLMHYPLESWNKMSKESIHIHGHCHGTLQRVLPHRYDAGVDAHGRNFNYGPVPLEYFLALAEEETYEPQDHH